MIIEFILRLLLGDDFVDDDDDDKSSNRHPSSSSSSLPSTRNRTTTFSSNDNDINTTTTTTTINFPSYHRNNNYNNFESTIVRLKRNDPTLEYFYISNYYTDFDTAPILLDKFADAMTSSTCLKTLILTDHHGGGFEAAALILFCSVPAPFPSSSSRSNKKNRRVRHTQLNFLHCLKGNNSITKLDISGHTTRRKTNFMEWLQLTLGRPNYPKSLKILNLSRCQINDQHIMKTFNIIVADDDDDRTLAYYEKKEKEREGDLFLKGEEERREQQQQQQKEQHCCYTTKTKITTQPTFATNTTTNTCSTSQLRELNLSKNKIRDLTYCLNTILQLHPNLQILDLSSNLIGKEYYMRNNNNNINNNEEVINDDNNNNTISNHDSLSYYALTSLDLSDNNIQYMSSKDHSTPPPRMMMAATTTITTLNDILLSSKLQLLTNLNLSWNDIGDDGLILISQNLIRIRKVNLTKCNITSKGSCHLAKVLTEAYQQQQQQQLRGDDDDNNNNNNDRNGEDDEMNESSSNCPRCCLMMRELSLSRNTLGYDGIYPFFNYPTSIQKLDLRFASFKAGCKKNDSTTSDDPQNLLFIRAIRNNTNLLDVKVGNYNPCSFKIKKEIRFWTHIINSTGIRQLIRNHNDHYHDQQQQQVQLQRHNHSTSVCRLLPPSSSKAQSVAATDGPATAGPAKNTTTTTSRSASRLPQPPPSYNLWPYILEKSSINNSPSAIYYLLSQTPELMMIQ